jgi:hypothetical protein
MMHRSIGIVYPYSHPDSNPTLQNIMRELRQRSWSVELYCGREAPAERGEGLATDEQRSLLNPLPRTGLGFAGRLAERARTAALPTLYRLARRHSVLVGVDPSGLVLAHQLNARAGVPLTYLSFEIMFREEVDLREAPLKEAELAACEAVSLALVQDEERAEALADATGLPRQHMVLVPNAPEPEPVPESDYLRRRLGIPDDKLIVLYSGTLAGWASLHLFGEMVADWPDRYVLVLHSRTAVAPRMRTYLSGLVQTERVAVSTEPVPSARLNELYASADFALAPYTPVPDDWTSGNNIFHIGLSSGKIAHAALCGLPLLASDLPVFRGEFARYRCGEIYSRVGQTGALLERMEADYSAYADEVRRFYAERMDPRPGVAAFCDRLEDLAR